MELDLCLLQAYNTNIVDMCYTSWFHIFVFYAARDSGWLLERCNLRPFFKIFFLWPYLWLTSYISNNWCFFHGWSDEHINQILWRYAYKVTTYTLSVA